MLIIEYEKPMNSQIKVRNEALNILSTYNYYKRYYCSGYVNHKGSIVNGNIIKHVFKVKSQSSNSKYDVNYSMDRTGHILIGKCNCLQFKATEEDIKHLLAFEMKNDLVL